MKSTVPISGSALNAKGRGVCYLYFWSVRTGRRFLSHVHFRSWRLSWPRAGNLITLVSVTWWHLPGRIFFCRFPAVMTWAVSDTPVVLCHNSHMVSWRLVGIWRSHWNWVFQDGLTRLWVLLILVIFPRCPSPAWHNKWFLNLQMNEDLEFWISDLNSSSECSICFCRDRWIASSLCVLVSCTIKSILIDRFCSFKSL